MRCLNCQVNHLGEIALNHYFCQECCLEFFIQENLVYSYTIDEEGELCLYRTFKCDLDCSRSVS